MTFIVVQVAIFLLIYLVCRSIARRRGVGHRPDRAPARRNNPSDFEVAFRRLEQKRRRETVRTWREQEAEITRVQARQDAGNSTHRG